MSEKLTKRDLLIFGIMFAAPFIAFNVMTWDAALVDMMENPISRLYYGMGASIIWIVLWAVAFAIDWVLKKRADRIKEDIEIDDPTLAFGQYLFDKEK